TKGSASARRELSEQLWSTDRRMSITQRMKDGDGIKLFKLFRSNVNDSQRIADHGNCNLAQFDFAVLNFQFHLLRPCKSSLSSSTPLGGLAHLPGSLPLLPPPWLPLVAWNFPPRDYGYI